MNSYRKFVYRFYTLAFNIRYNIALGLGLIRDEDAGLDDSGLFKNIFARAKKEDKLKLLWEKTEEAYGNYDFSENPFKKG